MLLAQNMWLVVVARCGFIIYVGKQTVVALQVAAEHDLTTTASCVATATWPGIKGFRRLPGGAQWAGWRVERNITLASI